MRRAVLVAVLGVFALLSPTVAIANAEPSSDTRYITYSDWAGYVTLNEAYLNSREMTIDVTIQATQGAIPVNPLYFIARAPDGTTYEYAWAGDTTLHSGDLPAGQKVRGTVVLDVSGGADPAQLIYEAPLGEQLATWSMSWKPIPKTTAPKRPAPFGGSLGS